MKPAQVRFYFDADVLGLGKLLAAIRPDITYRGDPGAIVHKHHRAACPIHPNDDEDWIPKVSALGWLIITRDSQIQQHTAEISAVRESGAKMVALAGDSAKNLWSQLELVMSRWRRIEELVDLPGPFIFNLSMTGGFTHVSLETQRTERRRARSPARAPTVVPEAETDHRAPPAEGQFPL